MSNFNAEVLQSIKEEVESTLLARHHNGSLKSEIDFIMGACAAMRIVNMKLYEADEETSMDCIPPMWLLWPMSGRSIVNELEIKAEGETNEEEE